MRGVKDFDISQGDIFDCPIRDAIISPANSFGFLDGGIDAVFAKRWPHLQTKLQNHLSKKLFGELPVGGAEVIRIHDLDSSLKDYTWFISAPTMRLPDQITETINVYLAFRAALAAIKNHNLDNGEQITTIVCPGMGTGIGKMPFQFAAVQMLAAYLNVIGGRQYCSEPNMTSAWKHYIALAKGMIK